VAQRFSAAIAVFFDSYQGTALAVPIDARIEWGFSPEV